MNDQKTFDPNMASAGTGGLKSILADPLAIVTKPAVIFKFAAAVSIV